MRTQRTTKGNRDACSSCSCDRELHRYLRNFGGGGFEHPKPPSVRHWAPAHFALSVRVVLNEHFPGRWIGRGSPTSPAPLSWPPHSPDLTTPDNSLWRYYQGKSGCASLQQQRFAQSCARHLSHNYSKNTPTYVT